MQKRYKNSYKVSEKELVSLSVYNVGYQKCAPLYQWGPGIRDHYLIHYVISGRGIYQVNGTKYFLKAGDTFLIYPNTEVSYQADDKDPWEYTWVGFNGNDAGFILDATDFSRESPIITNTPDGEALQRQFMHIYEARGNEFDHAVEMTGRLYTALAIFMKKAHHTKKQNTSTSYVQKAVEYISANYSYPITIDNIADYVGLSRSHLFRSFKTVMNQSPKEYLTSYRIRQACFLLANSNLSVTSIAGSVGFENSLYFSKAFHKIRGMSPKEFRAANTGKV